MLKPNIRFLQQLPQATDTVSAVESLSVMSFNGFFSLLNLSR